MRWVPLVVPILALAAGAAWAALAPASEDAGTKEILLNVTAFACTESDDGVCLAYGGGVPGPLLDLTLDDRVTLTLVNRIPETVARLDVPAEVKAELSQASVSFHAHGTSTPASEDGVPAHAGTQIPASVAGPGDSFTYHFRAAFAGPWHYHDHVLGHDGSEGTLRGLFGSIMVRGGAAVPPDHTFEVHVHNNGVNLGRGMDATVAVGSSFEVLFTGLGDLPWIVDFTGPDGATIDTFDLGPGQTERSRVRSALAGTYTWRAAFGPYEHTGTVVAR